MSAEPFKPGDALDRPAHIYLVRHGRRKRDPSKDESLHELHGLPARGLAAQAKALLCGCGSATAKSADENKDDGSTKVKNIAGALADALQVESRKINRVLFSPHAVSKQTADIFVKLLRERKCVAEPLEVTEAQDLNPDHSLSDRITRTQNLAKGFTDGLLIIGHQPQLTWLADQAVGGTVPAGSLPLGNGEVACLELGSEWEPGRLLWLLTEKPDQLKTDLHKKIQSKFDVAKFFLGALVVNASVILSTPVTSALSSASPAITVAVLIGYAALAVSLALTIGTLLAFDRLTMPTEFWPGARPRRLRPGVSRRQQQRMESWDRLMGREDAPSTPSWCVERPPSQDSVLLFFEMTHVWTSLFQPALFSALVAIAAFVIATLGHNLKLDSRGMTCVSVAGLAIGGAVMLYYRRHSPKLGFDD